MLPKHFKVYVRLLKLEIFTFKPLDYCHILLAWLASRAGFLAF
jgi:hypothetical protein